MTKANRKRRGRPKKEGIEREANGRASRQKPQGPADGVGIEARMRTMGLSKDMAGDPRVATFAGYLNILGRAEGLSDDQYDGITAYLEHRARLHRAIKTPGAVYDPEAPGGTGENEEAYAEWVASVRDTDQQLRKNIQAAQNVTRENLWAALDYAIVRGEYHWHMLTAVRCLANVFVPFFRTSRKDTRGSTLRAA